MTNTRNCETDSSPTLYEGSGRRQSPRLIYVRLSRNISRTWRGVASAGLYLKAKCVRDLDGEALDSPMPFQLMAALCGGGGLAVVLAVLAKLLRWRRRKEDRISEEIEIPSDEIEISGILSPFTPPSPTPTPPPPHTLPSEESEIPSEGTSKERYYDPSYLISLQFNLQCL